MSLLKREFAGLVRALRGALQWHREAGDISLEVPLDFNMPAFDSEVVPLAKNAPVDDQVEVLKQALQSADVQPKTTRSTVTQTVVQADVPVKPCWQVIPIDVSVGGSEMAQRAAALQTLKETIGTCTLCPLHAKRSEIVHGHGHPGARVMFIADGPGMMEDGTGLPFVGDAGLLLGRMIRAMGLKRNDTYLTYLTRCYSAGTEAEVGLEACASFLATEIQVVKPEVIVALGELSARRLTGHSAAFPHLRGKWFDYEGIPVLPTFHPEALLQFPQSKALVWTDLKAVMRHLGLTVKAPQTKSNR